MGRFVDGSDITGLFAGAAAGGFELIQGRVQAWDAGTLANTVSLLGSVRENLPLLNSAVADMAVGITVVMAPMGTTLLIIGKVRVP